MTKNYSEPREPREFPVMDDSPLNNGYGYNQREEEREQIGEPGEDECEWEEFESNERFD